MGNCGCSTFSLSHAAKEEHCVGYCTCLISCANFGTFNELLYEDYNAIHVLYYKLTRSSFNTIQYTFQYTFPVVCADDIDQYWKDVLLPGAVRGMGEKALRRTDSINYVKNVDGKLVSFTASPL